MNAVKIALSNENNGFVKAICSAMKSTIPQNAEVMFVGYSMGGMVIQQVIANKEIKKLYNITNTVAIGSPYIITASTKEGTLRRMVDRLDPVPYLSIPLLANPLIGNVSFETSYKLLVHFESYPEASCWTKYDCLGVKNGRSYFTLDQIVYQS